MAYFARSYTILYYNVLYHINLEVRYKLLNLLINKAILNNCNVNISTLRLFFKVQIAIIG